PRHARKVLDDHPYEGIQPRRQADADRQRERGEHGSAPPPQEPACRETELGEHICKRKSAPSAFIRTISSGCEIHTAARSLAPHHDHRIESDDTSRRQEHGEGRESAQRSSATISVISDSAPARTSSVAGNPSDGGEMSRRNLA